MSASLVPGAPVRVTYIISSVNKALAFEWIAKYLNPSKVALSFILLNPADSELEQYIRQLKLPVVRVVYRGKTDLLRSIREVRGQLKIWNSQVVHTHLFDANVVGLLAAWSVGVPRRILTRHHSTLHHQYFPRAVYYDRFTNALTTHIVAITEMVKQILVEKEGVSPEKIRLIHHGFDLATFMEPNPEQVVALRQKYQVQGKHPVIGVIARQTEWKGIQYIIPAFAKLREHYPTAKLILANAHGDYQKEIQSLLHQYLPADSYEQIRFENDLGSLYQLFDVYVHTPIDDHSEAFGQTYVEALAAGIPAVFTLSGVAPEFIRHEENALVVPFTDSVAITTAMQRYLTDPALCIRVRSAGQAVTTQRFGLDTYLCALEGLYCSK
jgi:glycosyltransferase involved in cell wall biosynthesis